MPELPEVETIVRGLRPLVGSRIRRAEILDPRIRVAADRLAGETLESVERRGKHIVFRVSGDWSLIIHLRMSGRLLLSCAEEELPHVRFRLHLDRGVVSFVNPRRLGTVDLLRGPFDRRLGIDPLSEEFTPEALHDLLRGTKRPIKLALTDQRRIAGLGNIYAAEALWRAGIAPRRPGNRIARKRIDALHREIVDLLEEAIRHSGTSFGVSVADYRDPGGNDGEFGEMLAVYGREGRTCRRCGAAIARTVQASRSTYWCPKCQH
ncbi:MAG: bifunctional DNA-formamidopyrimidine glycosylase/DNA-(apurinic or apyrimidinic site) lyase [Candidatus Bipolaricaulota bacterium]|nr:MAG: bifunctional DNA-formamidopyrimidine glycosylase/DNA-(apurinic or apyrimidinic site) lyase [Candidatus Bipolaricaulota bacterium]